MFILIRLGKLANIKQRYKNFFNKTLWGTTMTDANVNTKDFKEIAEKASDLAKNIWLAGLGAYGKAFDEAQGQYEKVSEKVNKESSRLFEELVAKGKKLEGETQTKLSEVKEKSAASLEERLAQVKESLSFSKNADLASKVDELTEKLDLIIEAVGAKAAPKKAAAPAKKASASATAEEK